MKQMEQTVTKYYRVFGSAGFANTNHENWVKVTGATEQECEKEIEIQVAAEWENICDSYAHLHWFPQEADYETEEEYQEAYNDALRDYEQDVECSYEDITEYVEQNQPYYYRFNYSTYCTDDWTGVDWMEI